MASPPPTSVKTLRAAGPVIIVILVVVAAFLGYYQLVVYPKVAPTSSTTTSTTTTGPTEKVVTITIPSGAQSPNTPSSQTYLPNVATVYIGYNASVTWINNDTGALHTVTADGTPPDQKFAAFGPTNAPYNNVYWQGSGQSPLSVNFTFTIPGTYNYSCSYHPWMKGSVIVKQAPPGLINSSSSASATSGLSSSASMIPVHLLGNAATNFASSLATLTGSGIAPWSVNLSRSLFEMTSLIPEVLTKIS